DPPPTPPFPYTTLFRSPELEHALAEAVDPDAARQGRGNGLVLPAFDGHVSERRVRRVTVDLRAVTFLDSTTLALLLAANVRQQRSEEHTSELQSRFDLV